MKKILIAVDSKKNTDSILSLLKDLFWSPEDIILLHVEQLEGNAMMTSMLGEPEMATLKEALKGTEHKEKLDLRAENILRAYREAFEQEGLKNISTVVKEGHPAEEILKEAERENVDMIVMNCSGKTRLQRFVTGCASKDVERYAKVPVLITKGNGCGEHAASWSRREAYAIQ